MANDYSVQGAVPAPSSKSNQLISYIFPIYNEEGNLLPLLEEMDRVTAGLKYRREYLFVNDGSTDGSIDILIEIAQRPDVQLLDLSRNFGHQIAVTAGIDAARGDAVIIMDADMQDPPRVCIELIREWEAGYDVVYAQRRSRQDTAFKKFTASMFYRTLSTLSDIEIPQNTGDFRLMSKAVVEEVRRYREHDRFLRGMVAHVGFRQKAVLFDRDSRASGETGYSLKSMLKLSADGILGFSQVPLKLISRVGFVVSLLSLLGIAYTLIVRFFFPQIAVEGWAFLACAIFLMGGIQTMLLGIIGSYVGRIFAEVKGRPLYSLQVPRSSDGDTNLPA